MLTAGEAPLTPAALARHIAAEVASRLGGLPGWSEREALARVSPRPVGGTRVWRTPLAGVLSAAIGESPGHWAELIVRSVERLPGVEEASPQGASVDIRFGSASISGLLPVSEADCRLWHGPPAHVVMPRVAPVRRSAIEPVRDADIDRAGVFVDALRGLARAAGDVVDDGPVSDHLDVAPVTVTGDAPLLTPDGEPTTPLRVALLLAGPGDAVEIDSERLSARTPSNPGFLLVHTALALRADPDCQARGFVRDDGADSLVVALASYPFVVEKGAASADPALVLRHLLAVADRAARLRAGDPAGRAHLWRSAATVLAHGLRALGVSLPTRI